MIGIGKTIVRVGIIFIFHFSTFNSLMAQTPQEEYEAWKKQAQGNYSRYRQQQMDEYQAFRKKANEEYAEFVKEAWARVHPQPPQKAPEEPKPPQPVVAPQDKPVVPSPMPFKEVTPVPEPKPVPEVPIPVPEVPVEQTLTLQYYGTTVQVHEYAGKTIQLKSLKPDDIAATWKRLSDGSCEALLADCLKTKRQLCLSDWGYLMLVRQAAGRIATGNEATLLEHWLLAQSGFRTRLAKSGKGSLQVWVPFDVLVYDHPFIVLDSTVFFLVTENDASDDELQVLDREFPGENTASLRMMKQPKLEQQRCGQRTFASKENPAVSLQVSLNKNLINYYSAYPKVAGSWDIYANASLSEEVKRQLYPQLRQLLKGLNELRKAEVLLNWIQTAFEYKTDEEQFGGERSLFADESLYYPYCDCEDLSILFSILVRDLLGLRVVLLHFPGHLATAVRFNGDVDGDYLELDDGQYIVCDPTYIGAPVGLAMPEFKEQEVPIEVFILE